MSQFAIFFNLESHNYLALCIVDLCRLWIMHSMPKEAVKVIDTTLIFWLCFILSEFMLRSRLFVAGAGYRNAFAISTYISHGVAQISMPLSLFETVNYSSTAFYNLKIGAVIYPSTFSFFNQNFTGRVLCVVYC